MSVRWPDVDHPRTPSGWSWPPNLLAAQGPASWPRGRRPASEAEEILSEAVAWWDVDRSGFRDGDRWLRNLGTGGGVLDLRLGSSLVANSNDPKWLGPEASGYVWLPENYTNFLNCPAGAELQVTGNLDLRARVALDVSPPASQAPIISRYASPNLAYQLSLESNGRISLRWSADGTAGFYQQSSVGHGTPAGMPKWYRATLNVNNGSSQSEVKFFTSDDGVAWTQLGTTITVAGTTSVYAAAGAVCQSINVGGRLYRLQVLDGIDGTAVLDIDCDAITSGSATTITALTGQTISIGRSSSGRKSVAMPARRNGGRACMLLGSDDFLEVQDAQQHGLLNFYGADSFTVLAVVRQWATPTAISCILTKATETGPTMFGYLIASETTGAFRLGQFGDGVNRVRLDTGNRSLGTLLSLAAVRSTFSDRASAYVNGALAAGPVSDTSAGSLATTQPLRIGQLVLGGTTGNFEFTAAAIWRRALTTREITVLANSGIWGT